MVKNLILLTLIGVSTSISLNAQFDMSGKPIEEKKKTKNDITSPNKQDYSKTQKKYQNQIVFSSSKIENNNENEDLFISTWVLGEPLHVREYHSQTLMESVYDYYEEMGKEADADRYGEFNEYYYADFSNHYVIYINGKDMAYYESKGGSEKTVKTWITSSGTIFDINKNKYVNGGAAVAVAKAFQSLGSEFKEGTFEIKIERYAMPSRLNGVSVPRGKIARKALMSSGKIQVNVTKAGMAKYANYLCRDLIKKNQQLVDAELETAIMKLVASENGFTEISVNIVDNDWTIKRNKYGVVTHRLISANVAFKNKDNLTRIANLTVRQDHDGSGFQKSIKTNFFDLSVPYCKFCSDYHNSLE